MTELEVGQVARENHVLGLASGLMGLRSAYVLCTCS
jgi:hypothetical protein